MVKSDEVDKGSVVAISKVELWVIRTVGCTLIALLGWIGTQFQTALIHIAEIRKELDVIKPAEVLAALNELERITLTANEVESIVAKTSPWGRAEEGWREWRYDVETRVRESAKDQEQLRAEFRAWTVAFQRENPNLKVPGMSD